MIELNLIKQLKKRLRRKRRTLWVLGSFVCLFAASSSTLLYPLHVFASGDEGARETIIRRLGLMDGTLSVKQRSVYVCGEEVKQLGIMSPKDIAAILERESDWTALLDADKKSIVLKHSVEDLSEHCKHNAYMGIDRNGYFSLFDGMPSNEKVLQTFFQMDMHYLESSLPKERLDELARGIRITDLDEYNSVLSTFSDYAITDNKNVLRNMQEAENNEN